MVTKGGTGVNGGDCKSLWCSRVPRCTVNNGKSAYRRRSRYFRVPARFIYTYGSCVYFFLFLFSLRFVSVRDTKRRAIISVARPREMRCRPPCGGRIVSRVLTHANHRPSPNNHQKPSLFLPILLLVSFAYALPVVVTPWQGMKEFHEEGYFSLFQPAVRIESQN